MDYVELLAPAGDRESLEAAVRFGADAVYLGGEALQLRAARSAFSRENIADAVAYVHERERRVYVTVNSFAKNEEIPQAGEYARFLADVGVDAAIISDIGVMAEVKRAAPDLEIHVSTQANCMNYAAARVYHDMGAKRIVLARETTLNEIAGIRAKTPPDLELEAFVHGAMCMAYSGRCILSSYLTGRSGNRGECAQPCRWSYALTEEQRPGEFFPIEEGNGYTAILSSHDLNCIDMLDELKSAGITSFKIEGRMKTAYYVATAVNAYRRALDGTDTIENCRRELEAIKHRPYSDGFYHGYLKENPVNDGHYTQGCVFIGNVLDWRDGVVTLRQRNHFKVGETLEVLSPGRDVVCFPVEKIVNETGEAQETAPHPNQVLFVPCPVELHPGDFLRRREEKDA